jgi:hypothetical protein
MYHNILLIYRYCLSSLPACTGTVPGMYNYPTVRTGMTYGRCTIGMVPLPYVAYLWGMTVMSCATVRLYVPGTLRLYLLEYCCTTDSPVCTTLLHDSLLISTYYSVRSIYITDHSIYYTGRTPSPVRYVRTYGRVLPRLRVYYDCLSCPQWLIVVVSCRIVHQHLFFATTSVTYGGASSWTAAATCKSVVGGIIRHPRSAGITLAFWTSKNVSLLTPFGTMILLIVMDPRPNWGQQTRSFWETIAVGGMFIVDLSSAFVSCCCSLPR